MVFLILHILSLNIPSTWGFTLIDAAEPYWQTKTVKVNYNQSSCNGTSLNLKDLIPKAIDFSWNSVAYADFELELGSNNSQTEASSGTIQVYCDSSLGKNTLGRTISGVADDQVVLATIALSTAADFSDEDLAKLTLGHELGHAIGFGHSSETEALMYFSLGTSRSRMAVDDVAAMSYLYGRNDLKDGPFGCGTITLSDQDFFLPGSGFFVLFLFGIAVITLGFRYIYR